MENKKVFDNIYKKLNYIDTDFAKDLTDSLLIKGKRKLDLNYSFNLAIENIDVTTEKLGETHGKICAKGKEVTFIEFGTGKVGERSGYPKAHLPTEPISFYLNTKTKSYPQTTLGWVYYYKPIPNLTKRKIRGKWGWFVTTETGRRVTYGMPAGKQVYNTAQYLKNNIFNIVEETLKEHN